MLRRMGGHPGASVGRKNDAEFALLSAWAFELGEEFGINPGLCNMSLRSSLPHVAYLCTDRRTAGMRCNCQVPTKGSKIRFCVWRLETLF